MRYELFNRLNTGGSVLTEQEIRNCIFLVIIPKLNLKNEFVLMIDYLKQNVQSTRENFENILNLGKSATINVLNEMLEKDIIEKIGFSKNVVYKLK